MHSSHWLAALVAGALGQGLSQHRYSTDFSRATGIYTIQSQLDSTFAAEASRSVGASGRMVSAASIHLVDVDCEFSFAHGIDTHSASVHCAPGKPLDDSYPELVLMSRQVTRDVQEYCASGYDASYECPPHFLLGMLEFVAQGIQNGYFWRHGMPNWKRELHHTAVWGLAGSPDTEFAFHCSDSTPLGMVWHMDPRDRFCPQPFHLEGARIPGELPATTSSVSCLCPWTGGYHAARYNKRTHAVEWTRPVGDASMTRLGRCSLFPASSSSIATQDCLNYASCADHLAEGAEGDCDDEFRSAMDDFLFSYGFSCC